MTEAAAAADNVRTLPTTTGAEGSDDGAPEPPASQHGKAGAEANNLIGRLLEDSGRPLDDLLSEGYVELQPELFQAPGEGRTFTEEVRDELLALRQALFSGDAVGKANLTINIELERVRDRAIKIGYRMSPKAPQRRKRTLHAVVHEDGSTLLPSADRQDDGDE